MGSAGEFKFKLNMLVVILYVDAQYNVNSLVNIYLVKKYVSILRYYCVFLWTSVMSPAS